MHNGPLKTAGVISWPCESAYYVYEHCGDMLRHPDDRSTIGLLLVREMNQTVAKYALASNTKAIGVAEWEKLITESLPEDLKPNLPSIEEIEKELGQDYG